MRSRNRFHPVLSILIVSLPAGAAIAAGCAATSKPNGFSSGAGGEGGDTSSTGSGTSSSSSAGQGGNGGGFNFDAGDDGAPPDVFMNPCGSECGPAELCDPPHIGLDDDCD